MTKFLQDPTTWVAVAFIIFVAFMYAKARKPMLAALDARATKIKHDLDEAQRLRTEAEKLLADYKKKQADALKEAEAMLRHAQEEGQRLRVKAEQDLTDAMKRREQQALDRIQQAEAQAVAEVRNMAVDIAVAATRKLLSEKMEPAKAAQLVDAAIRELPGKLH